MKFLVDVQLPPGLVDWLTESGTHTAVHFADMGLDRSKDAEVFLSFREVGAVITTKDEDFVDLVLRLGPPPQILWITCGNSTNSQLRRVFEGGFETALELLLAGEAVVELS